MSRVHILLRMLSRVEHASHCLLISKHPDVAFQRALTGSHSRLEELLIETFVVGVRQISWIVGSTAIVLAVLGFAATSSRWGDSRHTTTPTRAKLPFLGFNLFSLLYISLYQLFPFLT